MSVSVDLNSESSTSSCERSGDETSELVSDPDAVERRRQASDVSSPRDDRIPWFDWGRDRKMALVLVVVVVLGVIWAVAAPAAGVEAQAGDEDPECSS